MTQSRRGADWWLSPKVVFSTILLLVILTLLLSPRQDEGETQRVLTTHSHGRLGARGIYDVASRLGWGVARRDVPFGAPMDTGVVYVVLAPQVAITRDEVGVLVDAVRRGASLLVIPPFGSTLDDSLGVRRIPTTDFPVTAAAAVRVPPLGADVPAALRGDLVDTATGAGRGDEEDEASVSPLGGGGPTRSDTVFFDNSARAADPDRLLWASFRLQFRGEVPPDTVTFLVSQPFREVSPKAAAQAVKARLDTNLSHHRPVANVAVAVGYRLGRGRVVVVAEPDLLRNRAVRASDAGVWQVRMLEWLAPRGTTLVFDEYHHDFGVHASIPEAIRDTLLHTPPGRALFVVLVAGLVLLLAVAPRPIRPATLERIERRSPLEHVGALARAYDQVGATRLAARRLVRGLRRRHPYGVARVGSDEEFLREVRRRFPAVGAAAELLLRAVSSPVPVTELPTVGRAVEEIDEALRA